MSAGIVHCVTLYNGPQLESPLTVFLRYQPNDPYFVRMDIPGVPTPLDIARSVLAEGLNQLAESRDIQIEPSGDLDWLTIKLRSSEGQVMTLLIPRRSLGEFLADTYQAVLVGEEDKQIDWDGEYDLLTHKAD